LAIVPRIPTDASLHIILSILADQFALLLREWDGNVPDRDKTIVELFWPRDNTLPALLRVVNYNLVASLQIVNDPCMRGGRL